MAANLDADIRKMSGNEKKILQKGMRLRCAPMEWCSWPVFYGEPLFGKLRHTMASACQHGQTPREGPQVLYCSPKIKFFTRFRVE
jgi:hypothetical protein